MVENHRKFSKCVLDRILFYSRRHTDDSVVGRPLKVSHESAPDEEVKLFPLAILIVNLKVAI